MPDVSVTPNVAPTALDFLDQMQRRDATESSVLSMLIAFATGRGCSLSDAVDILALNLGSRQGAPSGIERERQQRFRALAHGIVAAYKLQVEQDAWEVAFRPKPPAPTEAITDPLPVVVVASTRRGVLETAERIHGAVTGASGGMPKAELAELVAWLRERVGTGWTSRDTCAAELVYDEAVRTLAREAVDLGARWLHRALVRHNAGVEADPAPTTVSAPAHTLPFTTAAADALRATLRNLEALGDARTTAHRAAEADFNVGRDRMVETAPREPLDCPACGKRHVDFGEWARRLHRTHRCVDDAAGNGCGHKWRIDHYAFGVRWIRFWACQTTGCRGTDYVSSTPGGVCTTCHAPLAQVPETQPPHRQRCNRPGCCHTGAQHAAPDAACTVPECPCATYMYDPLPRAHAFKPCIARDGIDVCRCNVERSVYAKGGATRLGQTLYQYRWAFPGNHYSGWRLGTVPPCETVIACIVCHKPIKHGQRTANDAGGRPHMHRKCSPIAAPARGGGR